jgi:hypothetical protein
MAAGGAVLAVVVDGSIRGSICDLIRRGLVYAGGQRTTL